MKYAKKVLDVGCGTGVLLEELSDYSSCTSYGLDFDQNSILFTHRTTPRSILTLGNALKLPYKTQTFDVSLCHFLLLWVKNPVHVIEEMARVSKPGGFVLALAEPDYGGRIDFPNDLVQIGNWQTASLKEQGANPFIGRELRSIFSSAGLLNIEIGILGGQWNNQQSMEDIMLEWEVISSDLNKKEEFKQSAEKLKFIYFSSHNDSSCIIYVPTFYAIGEVRD